MSTHLIQWTARDGKRRSAILHDSTRNDPERMGQWAAYNDCPVRCDLAPDAHIITGAIHTVEAAEIKQNACAYAEMLSDAIDVPAAYKDKFRQLAMGYALGGDLDLGKTTHSQHGDWAACDEHLALWHSYCAKAK